MSKVWAWVEEQFDNPIERLTYTVHYMLIGLSWLQNRHNFKILIQIIKILTIWILIGSIKILKLIMTILQPRHNYTKACWWRSAIAWKILMAWQRSRIAQKVEKSIRSFLSELALALLCFGVMQNSEIMTN